MRNGDKYLDGHNVAGVCVNADDVGGVLYVRYIRAGEGGERKGVALTRPYLVLAQINCSECGVLTQCRRQGRRPLIAKLCVDQMQRNQCTVCLQHCSQHFASLRTNVVGSQTQVG
jgi:hypothetical protein